jgi:hypothetical protein
MVRLQSARLAVPLILITSVLIGPLTAIIARAPSASAEECVLTPDGIECSFGGGGGGSGGGEGGTSGYTLYFGTLRHPALNAWCWYLSHFPPGREVSDPRNAEYIEATMAALPECPRYTSTTSGTAGDAAWEVFRSMALAEPTPLVMPVAGIANLPTEVTLLVAPPIRHSERLPDGRRLEVEAAIDAVFIDWGDRSQIESVTTRPGSLVSFTHPFRMKTCAPEYRVSHPYGRNCHPYLSAYPIEVTVRWTARYRTGYSWTALGSIERSGTMPHDVDEVVGFLVPG